MQTIAKLFCWIIIAMSLVNIPVAIENITIVLKWGDFAIIKIFASFVLVFYIWEILQWVKFFLSWIFEWMREFLPEKKNESKIYEGIPIFELVDYLFTNDKYSREEFCAHFATTRKVFDDLANWFDTIGVFTRGANNARVLNKEFSRSDIASIITRASETGEIRPLIREIKWWFTHSPTFKTIPLSEFRKMAS